MLEKDKDIALPTVAIGLISALQKEGLGKEAILEFVSETYDLINPPF